VVVFYDITDPGCLEALMCREAQALALDLGVDEVMVATNCLEVVQGLKAGSKELLRLIYRYMYLYVCVYVLDAKLVIIIYKVEPYALI
jgi:hypothetical protein